MEVAKTPTASTASTDARIMEATANYRVAIVGVIEIAKALRKQSWPSADPGCDATAASR
jgi:hypothetical protein